MSQLGPDKRGLRLWKYQRPEPGIAWHMEDAISFFFFVFCSGARVVGLRMQVFR